MSRGTGINVSCPAAGRIGENHGRGKPPQDALTARGRRLRDHGKIVGSRAPWYGDDLALGPFAERDAGDGSIP